MPTKKLLSLLEKTDAEERVASTVRLLKEGGGASGGEKKAARWLYPEDILGPAFFGNSKGGGTWDDLVREKALEKAARTIPVPPSAGGGTVPAGGSSVMTSPQAVVADGADREESRQTLLAAVHEAMDDGDTAVGMAGLGALITSGVAGKMGQQAVKAVADKATGYAAKLARPMWMGRAAVDIGRLYADEDHRNAMMDAGRDMGAVRGGLNFTDPGQIGTNAMNALGKVFEMEDSLQGAELAVSNLKNQRMNDRVREERRENYPLSSQGGDWEVGGRMGADPDYQKMAEVLFDVPSLERETMNLIQGYLVNNKAIKR